MENSILFTILKTFSKKEMRSFGLFTASPYFNTSSSTTRLYEALRPFYPDFTGEGFNEKGIFESVYPGARFSGELFRKNISNLIRLAEEFITQEKINELKYYKSNFSLNALLDRKLNKLFEKRMAAKEKDFLDNNLIDENYYSVLHRLNITKIYNHLQKNEIPEYLKQYESTANYFTIGFLNFIYKTYSQLLNFGNVFSYKPANPLLNAFINSFDFKSFSESKSHFDEHGEKIVQMYYFNYKMLLEPEDENNYLRYKELFFEVYSKISRGENFNLFLNLESYCSVKINSGKEKYLDELLYVYHKMFELGIYSFTEAEPLPLMQFRNILQVAFRKSTIMEFESTLSTCLAKIDKVELPNHKKYANAFTAFKKSDFNGTLKNLRDLNMNYFGFKTDCRNLQIMAYYELGHMESAISMIDSYRHFLAMNKDVNNILKAGCENFLRYFNKLIKLTIKPDETETALIKKELIDSTAVFNRWWLINKLDKLLSLT